MWIITACCQLAFWCATTHVTSLPFTKYLIGGCANISIFTLSLQGRNNFPHFADEKTEPSGGHVTQDSTANEDKSRLVFSPLYYDFILHCFILNHPPHVIPPTYSRNSLPDTPPNFSTKYGETP